jgi:predicted lipoprotein with Yx(FWY)xxD motif
MQPSARSRPPRRLSRLALLALVAVLLVPTAAGVARAAPAKRVVKLEESGSGGTVLANLKGRTLYSLSVEKHGKFICTAGCLSVWHPLVVPQGVKPTGPVKLGTVKRPDGRIQVSYRGRPLYSFAEDVKKGETNGEGFKDVGTWHAAMQAASSA